MMLRTVIEAASAFDGWGSALISGVVGAAFVLVGVVLAQRLADQRRAADARQTAVHNLMIRISDLRDAATLGGGSTHGEYDMFPLRNEMLISYAALGRYPSYKIVSDFYDTVRSLRSHLRGRKRNGGLWTDEEMNLLKVHLDAVYQYSEGVINILKEHSAAKDAEFDVPSLPPLPPL